MSRRVYLLAIATAIVLFTPGTNSAEHGDRRDAVIQALTASINKVSPECGSDIDKVLSYRGTEWADTLMDAWGSDEAGILTGNFVWEGRVNECQNSKATNVTSSNGELMAGQHCMFYWWNPILSLSSGLGMCLPNACTFNDTYVIMEDLPDWARPPGYPENRDKLIYGWCVKQPTIKGDPAAIGAISVLSVFGLLALIGTLYDAITWNKRHRGRTPPINNHKTDTDIKAITPEITVFTATALADSVFTEAAEVMTYFGGSVETTGPPGTDTSFGHPVDTFEGGVVNGNVKKHAFEGEVANGNVKRHDDRNADDEGKLKDYKPNTCGQVMLCFSIYTNMRGLASVDHGRGSFGAINGIRFLAMCWIILGHTWSLGLTITDAATVENYWDYEAVENRASQNIIKYSDLSVETFFVLSAMLTTVCFMRDVDKAKGKPKCSFFGLYYFHRYWRLTPVYMLLLMFFTTLFKHLGSGPFFSPHIATVDNCRDNWWKHLIYLNNLIDLQPSTECMGHTWYMANDFQFHVMAPAFLALLYWVPVAGIVMTVGGFLGGWISYIVLMNGVYTGQEVSWYYDIYTKPWCRCPTYFIGIFLGYAIYKTSAKPKLNKVGVVFGWVLALTAISLTVFLSWDSDKDPNNGWTLEGAMAAESFKRVGFAGGVSWIIYACAKGYGGPVNSLMSWRLWVPLAKLTYTGYLIHPYFLYYTYYSSPTQIFLRDWNMIYYFLGTLLLTLGASFIASLFLEIPFRQLEKVMFRNVKKY